ncbi:MAG: EF-hand domain-containing protein [Pirellulaceae bacterium]
MNRLSSMLLLLFCTLVLSVAEAQDPPVGNQPPAGGRGGRGPGPRGFGFQLPSFPLMEALDADKDGKLSKEEIENAVTALKKIDQDEDGKLSAEEIGWPPAFPGRGGAGGPGMGFGGPGGFGGGPGGFGGGPGGNVVQRIMSNDKDGDGKVAQAELPDAMQPMLQRADTNKDGAIDKSEAEAMAAAMGRRAGPGGGPGGFGGGPGGPGGFGGGRGGNFVQRIMSNDKDGDGKVTLAELPEAMQRIMQRADTNEDGAIDKAEAEALANARRPPGTEQPEQPGRSTPDPQ